MTSTNDGKDVKSYQTSGQKGKKYYLELYNSLEERLSGSESLAERAQYLSEAWRRIHSICRHAAPPSHPILLAWLERHTACITLQSQWQSPDSEAERTALDDTLVSVAHEIDSYVSERDGSRQPWEDLLLRRAEWYRSVLGNPWGHPVLKILLDPKQTPPDEETLIEWLRGEREAMVVRRVQELAASKCTDMAVSLAAALTQRRRAAAAADTDRADGAALEQTEATFENILRRECGFTDEGWSFLTDIEFTLLHKADRMARFIELAKLTPLKNGYDLIDSLQNRLRKAKTSREKKLWKNVNDVAILIAQIMIARCMVIPACAGAVRSALYKCAHALCALLPGERVKRDLVTLAIPAVTAAHLYTLAKAVHKQKSADDMKPFVCELYVRAITSGMNELEKLKLKPDKEKEARQCEQTLATWFLELGGVFSSARLRAECALTAFSVHPSLEMYERIDATPDLPPVRVAEQVQEPKAETSSEFGSWASDSRSQTNFVKTSEHLNMKQMQQANVLSTAILNEGEALGLGVELCQDIAVLLSGLRVKTLTWDLDRAALLANCRAHCERTAAGTRAPTTELRYLRLDPRDYLHLREEDDSDENDLYYGIEKGYEHLVEFPEPQPEAVWEDDLIFDEEMTESAYSTDSEDRVRKSRKKKVKKLAYTSCEDEDPLSIVAESKRKEKKKERPHSKERSKGSDTERSKEKKKKPKKEGKDKEKKKEKKERKKKIKEEKLSTGPLSHLIGVKVERPQDALDSDCDGKSSLAALFAEPPESNVEYDGHFSMDELKSPDRKSVTPPKVSSSTASANEILIKREYNEQSAENSKTSPINQEVKNRIAQLIHFRRNKSTTSTESSNSPTQSPVPHSNLPKPEPKVKTEPMSNLVGSKIIHATELSKNVLNSSKSSSNVKAEFTTKSILNTSQSLQLSNLKQEISNLLKTCTSPTQSPETKNNIHKTIKTINRVTYEKANMKETCSRMLPVKSYSKNRILTIPELQLNYLENLSRKEEKQAKVASQKTNKNVSSGSQNTITPQIKQPDIVTYGDKSHSSPKQKHMDLPHENQTRQSVIVDNKSPEKPSVSHQRSFEDFIKDLQVSTNAGFGKDRTKERIKRAIKPASKITSVPSILKCSKSAPLISDIPNVEATSPQSAKPVAQQKIAENAPNTFLRRSYMHKSKQNDTKPKCIVEQHQLALQNQAALERSVSEELDKRIADLHQYRMDMKSKQTSISITKVINTDGVYSKPKESPKVEITKLPPPHSSLADNHTNLKDMLQMSDVDANRKVEKATKVKSTKTNSVLKSALSEKDQQDLINMLRQQNKLNEPLRQNKTNANAMLTNLLHLNPAITITNSSYPAMASSQAPIAASNQIVNEPQNIFNQNNHSQNLSNLNQCSSTQIERKDFSAQLISKATILKTANLIHSRIMSSQAKTAATAVPSTSNTSNTVVKSVDTVIKQKPVQTEVILQSTPTATTLANSSPDIVKIVKRPAAMLSNVEKKYESTKKNWTSVMDALRKQKTPSRGPNALEMLLDNDAYEKYSTQSLRNQRIVRPKSQQNSQQTATNRDTTKFIETPTPISKVSTKPLKPTESIQPKIQINVEFANNKPVIKIQEIPKAVTPLSKPLNSESLREDDPFISGILNSEYELLEELMDDDLRKEIGELSSDEERTYTTPAITKDSKKYMMKNSSNVADESLRSATNAGNLQKTIKPKGFCETFNPVVEKIVLNPNTVDIKPSYSTSKAKPQILSNEKANIMKRPDIVQQFSKKKASQISQDNPSHPNCNISSANSANVDTKMIITVPPQPSSNMVVIRPDMAYEPYPTLHIKEAPINTKQSYVAANNTQTVNNIQLTPLTPIVTPLIVNPIGLSNQMCNVNLPYNQAMIEPETVVPANIPLVKQSNAPIKTMVLADVPLVKQCNAPTKTMVLANAPVVNTSYVKTKTVVSADVPVVKQSNAPTKTVVPADVPLVKKSNATTKTVVPANVPVVKQSNAPTKTVVPADVPLVKKSNATTKTVVPADVPVVKRSNAPTKTVVPAKVPQVRKSNATTKTVVPVDVPEVKQSNATIRTVVPANVPLVRKSNTTTKTVVPVVVPEVKQFNATTKTVVPADVPVVKQSNKSTKTIELKAASGPSSLVPNKMAQISSMKNKVCNIKCKKIVKSKATILPKTGSGNGNYLSKPTFIHNPDNLKVYKGIKIIKCHKPTKKQSRAGKMFISSGAKVNAMLKKAMQQTKEGPIKISHITSKDPGKDELANSKIPGVKIDWVVSKKDETKLKVEAQKLPLNISQFEAKSKPALQLNPKLNEVSQTHEMPAPEINIKPEIKQNNMESIINKSCERKVLSEVQEKLTTPSPEKVESKLTRNQRLSTDNDKTTEDKKEKEIMNDRERLKRKRWAIINREISHRCFDAAIALPYAPIQIESLKRVFETHSDCNALNNLVTENLKSKQETHTNSPTITSQMSEFILFNSSTPESPGNIENTLQNILEKSKGKVTTGKARKSKAKKAKMKKDKAAEICIKTGNDKQDKETSGNVMKSINITPTRVSSRIRERIIKQSDIVSNEIDSENIIKLSTSSEKQDIASTTVTRYVQTEAIKKSIPEIATPMENKTIPISEIDNIVSTPSEVLSSKMVLPTKPTPKLDASELTDGQVENEIIQILSSPEDTPDELTYPDVKKVSNASNELDCKHGSVKILSDNDNDTPKSVADTDIASPVICIVPKLVTSLCDKELENAPDNNKSDVSFAERADDKSMDVTDKNKLNNVISSDENGKPVVDTITIPALPFVEQAISEKTDFISIKGDDVDLNKDLKHEATKDTINMNKSDDIPLSYKNSIIFEELPSPNPNNPSMRCVRIQIPNGKTFKATIYGQMKINFDTLFENPDLKNILLSGISDKKRFTFSVQQIATANREIVDTRVKFNCEPSKKNIYSEVVNLISDDEDDDELLTNKSKQTFSTEFGTYPVKSMEEDTYKRHQRKFSQKCSINLKNCDSIVKKFTVISQDPKKEELNQLIDAVLNSHVKENEISPHKENKIVYHNSEGLMSTATEIINLDDSSDEDSSTKTHSIEKIDELKTLLLKDLGVADVDSATSDKETEDTQKSSFRLKRSNSKKKFKAYVAPTKNDFSDIIPFKCCVKLKRCDNLVRKLKDEITESNVSDEDIDTNDNFEPKLSRSGSFSILNNLTGLDDVIELTEHGTERSSPTIDIVQTITAFHGSLETHSCMLSDFVPILNTPDYHSYKTGLLCYSDWFDTKKDLQRSLSCDLIPESANHIDVIDSKTDVSTDYESDTDITFCSNVSDPQNTPSTEASSAPSLKKLMIDYYIRDSMSVCKNALITCKRKSIEELNEVANKVIKIKDSACDSLKAGTEASESSDSVERSSAKETMFTEIANNIPILDQQVEGISKGLKNEISINQFNNCLKKIVCDYIVNNWVSVILHSKYSTPTEQYAHKITKNQKQISQYENSNDNKIHEASSMNENDTLSVKVSDTEIISLENDKPHADLPNTDLNAETIADLFSKEQKCTKIEMSPSIILEETKAFEQDQINETIKTTAMNTKEFETQSLMQSDQNEDVEVSIHEALKETDFTINKDIADLNLSTEVEFYSVLPSENETILDSLENLGDKAAETSLSEVALKTAKVLVDNDSEKSDTTYVQTNDTINSVTNVYNMENETTITTTENQSTTDCVEELKDKADQLTFLNVSQPDATVNVKDNSMLFLDNEYIEKSPENPGYKLVETSQPGIAETTENIIESSNELKNRPENITGTLKGATESNSENNSPISKKKTGYKINKSFAIAEDIAYSQIIDLTPGVEIESMVTKENVESSKDLEHPNEINSLELLQKKLSEPNSDKKSPNIDTISENKCVTIFAITEDTADSDIIEFSEETEDKTDIFLSAENEALSTEIKSNTTEEFQVEGVIEAHATSTASLGTTPNVNQIKHENLLRKSEIANEGDVSRNLKEGGIITSVCLDGNDNLTSQKGKNDSDKYTVNETSEKNTETGSKDQEKSKNNLGRDTIFSSEDVKDKSNNTDHDCKATVTFSNSVLLTKHYADSYKTLISSEIEGAEGECREEIRDSILPQETCENENVIEILRDDDIELDEVQIIAGKTLTLDQSKYCCETEIVEGDSVVSPIDSTVRSPKAEDLINTDKNQENILTKNVSKSYREDTGVVLKGVEYDDPVVGTYYVFSLDKSSDSSANNSNAAVESFEEMQINESDSENLPAETKQWTDNSFDYNADMELMIPKQTYSKRKLKRKLVMGDMSLSVKKRRISKLKPSIDNRKLSNADICDSLYVREFSRLLDYCSNIEFSYSISFHREQVDVENILNDWPIKYDERSDPREPEENDEASMLFTDLDGKPPFDPLTQTLSEELTTEYVLEESCEADDSNANMGFGERSGRVNQNFESDGVTKFSAATLSDVKHSQPFLLSEDYDDCGSNNHLISREKDQREKIRRSIAYIQLREKVRSFFAKTAIELAGDIVNVKDKENQCDSTTFPFDLYIPKSFQPTPSDVLVKVVQVGQLPVSAAAQNPVTCDPRVTQVSDASPSQCSEENSPRDDLQQGIKTEYTELTTADLSMPMETYQSRNQTIPIEDQEAKTGENIPIETELIKSEVKIELVEETSEDTKIDETSELPTSNHFNNVDYCYGTNNINTSIEQNSNMHMIQPIQDNYSQQKHQNGAPEKTDQIAHAMSAAGISTTAEPLQNTRAQALVNIISQKIRHSNGNTAQNSINTYSKSSPITAMALQQALAQILPPPLNQTNMVESNQQGPTPTVTPQVLHIVQGKNASGNQITLVDSSQQSVINQNATPVLHIVQNKGPNSAPNSSGNNSQQQNPFSGLSLVDTGLQQGGNQLLHIVNTGNQKNTNAGQLLKRVNLLTNLTNVPGSNDQKMVQFVCKAADGKSIQLNAPHQRSMVLRLQPIESPNMQSAQPKPMENQDMAPSPNTPNSGQNKESSNSQQEIKSRSIYEENYAKFIQNSTTKPTGEKSTSLPKFNQAFGKSSFQDGNQKQTEISANNSHLTPPVNTNNDNSECPPADSNSINLDHISQMSSPPLLLRKSPQTSQPQQNLVQQIKQTIAPMNIQTMHGGVIYTRQIPVNIGGGQTINLITVPSTELIDDKQQSEVKFVNQSGEIEPSIIKIVPQSQPAPNTEITQDESNNRVNMNNENVQNPQPQPVLTQMRIKLPMLSKTPQVVSGARVVRPSFFQIQRNVIGGANQQVYQQLVLTAAPPLGQQTIRLPQAQAVRPVKAPSEAQSSPESQMSSSTLEQLREFDMVLEQVKERSTVQPNSSGFKLNTTSNDTTDSNVSGSSTSVETTQPVLYSIGGSQQLNVAYVNRKAAVATPSTSTFVRSPDSSGVADSPGSSNQAQTSQSVSSEPSSSGTSSQSRPRVSSKSKSRPKSSHSQVKINSVPPKPTTQKPLEDEQTTQRILYILAEYKEQVENSPDKDKPAPRRRSNPPSNPGSSKRKKSSSGSRRPGARDVSPVQGDDACRTMGSEDSSCGTSQGDCTESCMETHSPQDSPRKVARKLTFEQESAVNQPRPQPQRNVIVADGQAITVARGAGGKPATAVLMPANYILPVSMVKGGQQIAIVTNRGPKLLTVGGGEGGGANALLLQRLISPAGLKPVLARPGVRHVRLPTAALHNLQTFNLAPATPVQPPDSTASPAPAPTPPELIETRAENSPWTERESENVRPERPSSPEGSEPWNMPTSSEAQEYSYEETVRAENIDRTVLDPIPDRYSPDMEAQRIFDKMFDVESKKCFIVDSHDEPHCGYGVDASEDDKGYQVVQKKEGASHRQHRVTHISAAALRHKYAILEHELRLQKSLSEECEDLGVDSPSASELFPEAELLFAGSPAQDPGEASHHNPHTPQPTIHNQTAIQPDIDDQIATDQLLPRADVAPARPELDVNLGLGDVGIVTVSEDGMQATIALDQEEFARSHPNTTFHSEPTDGEVQQPFTITGIKGGRQISTIFHANRVPATVLMTAPQAGTVISQTAVEPPPGQGSIKYSDIDHMITLPASHTNNVNLNSVLVKDDGLTRYDNILTDSRELHLSNTASAIVHPSGNATQVIRRVCYDEEKRERDARYLMDEPDTIIAGDDAKMIAEDNSRDAHMEAITEDVDDDNSSSERHVELFWESNSASERSESRRPLDFSSDSEKGCKSPSYDETNSTDSSGVGSHVRHDSVIKEARFGRSGSAEGSSADDTHPPLRTYPPKRMYHNPETEIERSLSGKTRAGEHSPDLVEGRRRTSVRGVVKRGCHCCNGSPTPAVPRPKKPRQRKPTLDFNTNT